MFSQAEIEFLVSIFNRGGYVLNFSDAKFSEFTRGILGYSLKDKYGDSKGKSMETFIRTEKYEKIIILVKELYLYEKYNEDKNRTLTDNQMNNLKEIIYKSDSDEINYIVIYIEKYMNNTYFSSQMRNALSQLDTSPSDVIGKSKDLLESCFKFILDKEGVQYSDSINFPKLKSEVFDILKLNYRTNDNAKSNEYVKSILTSLNRLVDNINLLRGRYGTGHGKGKGFTPLPSRYARLTLFSSLTTILFVLETYDYIKKTK